ncbi:MAG: DUF5676 family membrane protein [Pseudomonadales bacterium]
MRILAEKGILEEHDVQIKTLSDLIEWTRQLLKWKPWRLKMKLNANALALAVTSVVAVVWVVCSIIVALLPSLSMNMTGYMMHSDFSAMQWSMSLGGFVAGLVMWSIFAGAIAWLIATLYNRFSG